MSVIAMLGSKGAACGLLPMAVRSHGPRRMRMLRSLFGRARGTQAGLPTSASEADIGMVPWMPQTRHKSVKVAMGYARRGMLLTNNPAGRVGL